MLRDQQSDQRGRAHVQQADHNTHKEHEYEHDNGIGDQLLLAGPGNLLQLIEHVPEGPCDPLGQFFEPADNLAQLALSGFFHGFFSLFSRLLYLRHFFHILTALIDVGSLGLAMSRVLLAEGAILHELNAIRSILLVFHIVVVALLALGAGKANLVTGGVCHLGSLLN
jgi:hypothetical protein